MLGLQTGGRGENPPHRRGPNKGTHRQEGEGAKGAQGGPTQAGEGPHKATPTPTQEGAPPGDPTQRRGGGETTKQKHKVSNPFAYPTPTMTIAHYISPINLTSIFAPPTTERAIFRV